jgi:hypothetical protein
MTMVRFLDVGYGPFEDVERSVARQLADMFRRSADGSHVLAELEY